MSTITQLANGSLETKSGGSGGGQSAVWPLILVVAIVAIVVKLVVL